VLFPYCFIKKMYVDSINNNTGRMSQRLSIDAAKIAMIMVQRARPAYKLWLETDEGHVFGPGVYSLLRKIQEKGTLKEAAASLGMSYRYAWGLIKKAEEKLGEPLISATKGGRHGGGSTEITELGRRYVRDFERFRRMLDEVSEGSLWETKVQGTVLDAAEKGDHVEYIVEMRDEPLKFSLPKGGAAKEVGDVVLLHVSLEN
jgi:molybdate transport system regulatory protein